jgi:hypothetical protein
MTEINCGVPYCDTVEKPTRMFDDTNITCWTCKKFTCSKCVAQIWKGSWGGDEFYKPKFVLPGLLHQVFKCPHCRASFDRMLPVDKNGEIIKYERRLRTTDELELPTAGDKK